MVIYATVVSVLLVLSFVVNIFLLVASWQIVKENEFLEDGIKSKG